MTPNREAVVERDSADVSPKVSVPTTVAFVTALVDAVLAGDIDPVKFGIAVVVGVVGYFVKDRVDFDKLLVVR